MQKIDLLNKINLLIYAVVGALAGFFLYQYSEFAMQIGGIVLSFVLLNGLVLYYYNTFKEKPMAAMKFMAFNFLKDIIWAVFWMFMLKKNEVLTLFLVAVFLLLSIPLYISVIRGMKNNQKSDKNQL